MTRTFAFLRLFALSAGVAFLLLHATSAQEKKAKFPAPKAKAAKTPELPADHAERMAKGTDLFKKHVRQILTTSCVKCHGGRSVESELDLTDREGLVKGGQHGPVIVPFHSEQSVLLKLVRHQKDPKMPHNGSKLSDAAIAHLSTWVDLGAPYDTPLTERRAKATPWTERVVQPETRDYWAFQPLGKHQPPAVKNAAWARSPIDRFILSAQEKAGLSPNPPAGKIVLFRRIYADLIGLPPTPEEVDAFLADTSSQAMEKAIDRLLASPHYGERWGRHWLDLARFAESHGFEHDYDRKTAYHYRDFVIEALNRDLPYDTFVRWQIAGDELAPNDNLALKATGFLAAGVHSTQITKSEVEKHRYDELDDKLNTLSQAMLGLTVGCARCHDHKYDPIPSRDYYRMLSTFTTTVRSEINLEIDPEGFKQAKAAFNAKHAPVAEALAKYQREQLPAKLAAWEKTGARQSLPWETLSFAETKTKGEAKLVPQADGSLLATGPNAKFDVYTLTTKTPARKITGIRLEALSHASMVKGGPGRAGNGNFALSNFAVSVTPNAPNAKAVKLKLANPRATFEQKGLPIKAVVDADPKSAWAVDPQFGNDHAAVFDVENCPESPSGWTVTFTLNFNNNDGHQMGRIRLSTATGKLPADPLVAASIPAKAREALEIPADKRTAEQTKAVLAWFATIDSGAKDLSAKVQKSLAAAPKPTLVKCLVATEGLPAVRLHTQGEDFLKETHFLRRGDPGNKEGVATQSFLQVLMPKDQTGPLWKANPPTGARTSFRRKALADWITDVDHGGGALLARVIVNRVWHFHMGRGIVATPSDFGTRGEAPTHPELLDWLARDFVAHGWSLKRLHKQILSTATYQQSSLVDEEKQKIDRENKYCWRHPSRRLEAEVIRDHLLAVSGQLDTTMFGPGTLDANMKRRSIYFTVKRSKLVPMMLIFDAPEALSSMADRPTTTIAPQALHLLNNPQVRELAKAFAKRAAPDASTTIDGAIRRAYKIAVARTPTPEELVDGIAFVRQQMATYGDAGGRRDAALADFCQVLFCLNEFVYVD